MDKVIDFINVNRERYLEELKALLAIPSISALPEHAGDRDGAIEHDQAATYLDSAFAMPHLHLGLVAKRSADAHTARRELAHALPLLAREDASRILLFGGGFTRGALVEFCRAELHASGGA